MAVHDDRGRHNEESDEESSEERLQNEDFDPAEYDTMLRLERLESLEEEMIELDVKTLDEVRARIAQLHRELDKELREP